MSKIADFKKRQLEAASKQAEKVTEAVENSPAENLALRLLAQLLNVAEENAIETAQQYVDRNINFFAADFAKGKDKTVVANIKNDNKKNVVSITAINDVDELNAVKGEIENSADNVSLAASDLAYTADDINNATETLKEATSELKKPSGARKSSSSKKAKKPKSSSKK